MSEIIEKKDKEVKKMRKLKCPNCGEKVDCVDETVAEWWHYKTAIDEDGSLEYDTGEYLDDVTSAKHRETGEVIPVIARVFRCPECEKKIAESKEELEELVKKC